MALKDIDAGRTDRTGKDSPSGEFKPLTPAVLPEITSGVRVRQLTPFGNMHINITVDPKTQREMEVFAQLGKGGDLANSDLEAICRMVSLWLRAGGSLDHVIRQLHGSRPSLQVHTKEGRIMSLGDGLARALRRYTQVKDRFGLHALLLGDANMDSLGRPRTPKVGNGKTNGRDGNGRNGDNPSPASNHEKEDHRVPSRLEAQGIQWQQTQYKVLCPDCQGRLRFSEGCMVCEACGFSKC